MAILTSMNQITLYTVLTSAVLISFGTGRNPLRAAGVFARNLAVNPRYLLLFGSLLAILFMNKLELIIESKMKHQTDFTPFVQRLEGGFVEGFQQLFHAAWLTPVLAFFYVVVFQSLLVASLAVYMYRDKTGRQFSATCYAIMLNYLIAIPFYLFMPVKEVWAYNPNVHFYMLEAFPAFETVYRGLSGLDNCFPSLHTSISVTLALLGARSGIKRWAWLTGVTAAIIIFTIFYMGIHWLTDMLGGLCLATFAVYMGYKLADLKSLAKPIPSVHPSR
ncbi:MULTISPECIES: phosphatase PAP2 family protein [Paenibacillus]|uniref:phosphatase PAP2 family protein n=1 Tax=Paenibacillus TaxID=44249 RepID=UPI0004338B33|nr:MULTISPECIES: phosphatase PAP2 family protein [Paenibacillus]CDN42434.1 Phosphoesterase PA-phosphatase related protein [Paenibacillus sp. P22]